MSRYRSDPEMLEVIRPSACSNFLRYTWKAITCLFSHITLVSMVVSYCILGAFTFAKLEVDHEKEVKKNISKIRFNVTDELWKLATVKTEVLEEKNFTDEVILRLREFEKSLLKAMTKDGWDGEEDAEKVQWTITGALFYSIVVITTIGYGHICPKTTWGKIVTIFYAILGIPLMLICLSNIGDVMATSFRFLYWKVCCYVCTKKPKKKRRSRQNTIRLQDGRLGNRPRSSFRRSVRMSTRSADSGFPFSEIVPSSYSDTELRYHEATELQELPRGASLPRMRTSQHSRHSDSSVPPPRRQNASPRRQLQAGSLDRRNGPRDVEAGLDPALLSKTPILCNKYAMDPMENNSNHLQPEEGRRNHRRGVSPLPGRRAISMPRSPAYLAPPREMSPHSSREDLDTVKTTSRRKRASPSPQMAPRMMTPMGYGPTKYLDEPDSDEDYYDDGTSHEPGRNRIKPVPIWLCVFLVVSYIIAGAFLFDAWEGWGFLDSAYFCFITLTTIGFGDLVPAKGVKKNDESATISIALCSLYLLFGIALLAMSFNLVQEEVIANVKTVAKTLGIIKSDEDESDIE